MKTTANRGSTGPLHHDRIRYRILKVNFTTIEYVTEDYKSITTRSNMLEKITGPLHHGWMREKITCPLYHDRIRYATLQFHYTMIKYVREDYRSSTPRLNALEKITCPLYHDRIRYATLQFHYTMIKYVREDYRSITPRSNTLQKITGPLYHDQIR